MQGQRLEPCSRHDAEGRLAEMSLTREQKISPLECFVACSAQDFAEISLLRNLHVVCRADARSSAGAGPLVSPQRAARSRPK